MFIDYWPNYNIFLNVTDCDTYEYIFISHKKTIKILPASVESRSHDSVIENLPYKTNRVTV